MLQAAKQKLNKSSILGFVLAIMAAVAVLVLFDLSAGGRFLDWRNLNSIFSHAIIQTMVAWCFAFVFAAGYMDLSLGAVMVLAGLAAGEFGNLIGYPGVILGGLFVGVVLMLVNNLVFAYSKIPTWIAGLGLTMVYEGVAIAYSNSKIAAGTTVVLMEEQYTKLATTPYIYLLFAACLFFVYLIYNHSTPGLNLRAMGGNEQVTRAMGINVNKTVLQIALVCGVLIGLAGLVNQSYSGRVFAKSGLTSLSMTFKPLATLLLAQVLSKKLNLMLAMPICATIIYMLFNMLSILGVPSGTLQDAILGLCIIMFGIVAQRGVKGVVK